MDEFELVADLFHSLSLEIFHYFLHYLRVIEGLVVLFFISHFFGGEIEGEEVFILGYLAVSEESIHSLEVLANYIKLELKLPHVLCFYLYHV